ncbi:MAG: FtsX-like permease family protein, partial [Janthinobacterium lividum]
RQDSSTIADAMRKSIWSVDPEVPVPAVRTLSGVVTDSLGNRRFEMNLLLLFAVSAMLLAGLGVFGVVNYSVVQRQQELGLRLALGAQRGSIYRLVLVDGLSPVVAGGIAGIAVASGFARVLQSLLFEVNAYNPILLSSSACLLILVGVAACLLPASHAASTNPMQALKRE